MGRAWPGRSLRLGSRGRDGAGEQRGWGAGPVLKGETSDSWGDQPSAQRPHPQPSTHTRVRACTTRSNMRRANQQKPSWKVPASKKLVKHILSHRVHQSMYHPRNTLTHPSREHPHAGPHAVWKACLGTELCAHRHRGRRPTKPARTFSSQPDHPAPAPAPRSRGDGTATRPARPHLREDPSHLASFQTSLRISGP